MIKIMIIKILATIGICYVISESNLFTTQREWIASKHRLLGELIYCPICLSLWIALLLTFNLLESCAIMGVLVILIKLYEKNH